MHASNPSCTTINTTHACTTIPLRHNTQQPSIPASSTSIPRLPLSRPSLQPPRHTPSFPSTPPVATLLPFCSCHCTRGHTSHVSLSAVPPCSYRATLLPIYTKSSSALRHCTRDHVSPHQAVVRPPPCMHDHASPHQAVLRPPPCMHTTLHFNTILQPPCCSTQSPYSFGASSCMYACPLLPTELPFLAAALMLSSPSLSRPSSLPPFLIAALTEPPCQYYVDLHTSTLPHPWPHIFHLAVATAPLRCMSFLAKHHPHLLLIIHATLPVATTLPFCCCHRTRDHAPHVKPLITTIPRLLPCCSTKPPCTPPLCRFRASPAATMHRPKTPSHPSSLPPRRGASRRHACYRATTTLHPFVA